MIKMEQHLRIGLVSFHSFANPGGVKNHIIALQKEFKKRGIFSKIIVPRRNKKEYYGEDVMFFGRAIPITFNGSGSDFSFSINIPAFKKILLRENINVLHFHNFGFLTYQILTQQNLFKKLLALPYFTKENLKSLTFNRLYFNQILKAEKDLKAEKKRGDTHSSLNILTFHSHFNPRRIALFKQFPFLLKIFQDTVADNIDGIIGVSPVTLGVFKKFPGPTAVIPNGIDIQRFNLKVKKIKKYDDGKINILFVGRIEERKGLIYLLRAWQLLEKKFSNLRLIIVGEGQLKKSCQEFVKERNFKNVLFEGEVSQQILPSYYASCDIFVSPAIFGESFGIVLLEAMASAKPVVAFANAGYKQVLTGQGKDFLVKPKDWRGLARKIEILIKNKSLRMNLGRWGRRTAQDYSWVKVADKVLNFYQQVLAQKKKS